MAKPDRLKEIEAERGDLHAHIPPLVNRGGQRAAADALKITQSTVSRWLSENHYHKVEIWVREGEQVKVVPMESVT